MATNFYNKASLVMIPDAPLDGKLLSVKPEDRSGDFTFSRGSNLAATRVGADGLIEKGRENLLLQSNQFDTTWTKSTAITATSGQSGYDGSSDAWLLERSDGSARYIQQAISLSGINTISFYAKADNENWVFVGTSSANAQCYYNLSDGSIGTKGSLVVDANAEYIGSGWYRISMTINGAFTYIRIYPAVGNESVSGATDASLFIQDAQAEIGLAATDYIESGATTGKAGLLENEPRLDYTNSSCPALLLEPQRTNLLGNSEWFGSGSGWSTGSLNLEANADVSPEGVQNATKIVPTTDNVIHSVYKTSEQHADHIYSAFVKADGYNWVLLTSHASSAPSARGTFFYIADDGTSLDDRIGETGIGITPKIESFGNGWFRISIEPGNSTSSLFTIIPSNADGVISFTGDGTSGILIYGLQRELGIYPTSYIPTYGTSVTRNAGYGITNSIPSLFGSTEGSFYIELKSNYMEGIPLFLESSDNAGYNYATYLQLGIASVTLVAYSGGASQASISSSGHSSGETLKVACAYKNNDFVMYVNGQLAGTDASGVISTNLNKYVIGRYPAAGTIYQYNGNVNQALLFKTRLENDELAALTTI